MTRDILDDANTGGRFVRLDDGVIHVVVDGAADGPAVVLLHGSGASLRSWDPMAAILAASHRVIRIDLLGHGRSGKPAGDVYQTAEQGRRVGQVLDRLGVPRAVLLAHSSGGLVATALSEQRPELVGALALIDTGPSLDAFIAQDFAFDPEQWPELSDEQIRRLMRPAFSRAGFRIPRQLIADVRAMTLHSFTATMRAGNEYLRQRPLPDRLAPLGKPLLVLFGEQDRRWRPASAADYRAVPGARVELLPGLGHSPILEDPPRTAEFLLSFIALHA
ncbi:alpha/beta fold hydrolase [Sciscionella sediminilitoris]|uniref:alpha/beta fold hydrolase n=1 Tax=Sciscionella sediminilitoris TaxID=1445613 RepID=UPI000567386D|nr:alpha/beta fold hydrolase [Sciscionella sp. SE31]